MFRRNNKTRKYQAPYAKVTHMALESNFCATVRFKLMMDVDPLENMNDRNTNTDIAAEYFEDIVS
jgi:hypothetical protein